MKTFLNILSGIGIILWTIGFFFGLNYVQSGALMVCLPVALFLGVALGFFIWQMKRKSNPEPGEHAKRTQSYEFLLLGLYTIVCLCSAVFICHMVAVTTAYQSDIQNKAKIQMVELGRIFGTAETAGSYMQYVTDKLDTYRIEQEGKNKKPSTIEVEQAALETELCTTSGYLKLESEVKNFLGSCYYVVENWNWFMVGNYLQRLQANKPLWEKKVEECSANVSFTRNEPYDCRSEYNYSGLTLPLTRLSLGNCSPGAILLILILQLMILLTYIVGRPAGRSIEGFRSQDPGIRSWDDEMGK